MPKNSSQKVKKYLEHQLSMDTLRFITCGSVDDGKSTLIGRLLAETDSIFDDQLETLKHDSEKAGTQGDEIDYALLVDGLSAEREQGITIDVAYRFFSTPNRKFIVADTPGHEQYTRNMATGASTADAALILIDSSKGISSQTKRHLIICSYLGVKHVVAVINKMDLIAYNRDKYQHIADGFTKFSEKLSFKSYTCIPVSALWGDNLVSKSKKLKWYGGETLISLLNKLETSRSKEDQELQLPVQWVNRESSDFRGFSGTIETGSISLGEKIKMLPSNQEVTVKSISTPKGNVSTANTPTAVTISLDEEVDISRGDWFVSRVTSTFVANQFEANIIWMGSEPGFAGRSFWLKTSTCEIPAEITSIKHKININSLEKLPSKSLNLNELSVVNLKTARPIPFQTYQESRRLGSFILIDRVTYQTVAGGMFNFALHRGRNIYEQRQTITKTDRRALNKHDSKVIWLTGLSGAGKSTIADSLEQRLFDLNVHSYILDGDNIRFGLCNNLGFTAADRVENIRRVAEVAKLMVDAGIVVIVALISPFEKERQTARALFEEGEFIEVFVDAPLNIVEERDTKGLYKKAKKGEIPNFTGITSPYEKPQAPDVHLQTDKMQVEEGVELVLKHLNLA